MRPYLGSHGGDVEVLGIDVRPRACVHPRMLGSCDGCPSSSVTLKLAVKEAIEAAAPEIVRIEVADDQPAAATPVSITRKTQEPRSPMAPIYGLRGLVPGRVGPLEIDGTKLIVCRVGTQLYAYRSRCPSCRAALDAAVVDGPVLRCDGCGSAYDLPRAGRSLDGNTTHLDPLPLIEEGGEVRIAVAAVS